MIDGYIIQLRSVGLCPMGWPAYRGYKGTAEHNFYYIQQPDYENEMQLYRCSKDWEPDYAVKNKFVVMK